LIMKGLIKQMIAEVLLYEISQRLLSKSKPP